MIVYELLLDGRIRHYSDIDVMIKQVETDQIYEDAVDILPCPYTYIETDIPIEDQPTAEELLSIIVGGEIE